MKKQQQLGLVVEGRVSESVVLRLPSVLEQIGPIMSPVSGMAKRVVNALHAGYIADRYDDLQVARTVQWIARSNRSTIRIWCSKTWPSFCVRPGSPAMF